MFDEDVEAEILELEEIIELEMEDDQLYYSLQEADLLQADGLQEMNFPLMRDPALFASSNKPSSDFEDVDWIMNELEELEELELEEAEKAIVDFAGEVDRVGLGILEGEFLEAKEQAGGSKEMGRGGSLGALDLDERLICYYSKRGLKDLYNWQYECITQPGVLEGRNLVYSAPTSGGKTLVSELLMFRRVIQQRRGALVVFPFVSLVSEKKEAYYKVAEVCGLKVSEFHYGSKSPLYDEFDIGVATIEKANALVNYYIQHGTLFRRLGTIVVDELHLLADEQRGYILEVMLTKVRLLSKLQGEGRSIQIVGMSATLPNLRDIGFWLDAVVYQSNFRPVPLNEYIVLGGKAYLKPKEVGVRIGVTTESARSRVASWESFDILSSMDPKDFDFDEIGSSKWRYPVVDMKALASLGWEALRKGESVLVFCPSKYSVESTAMFFARILRKHFCEGVDVRNPGSSHFSCEQISQVIRSVDRQRLQLAKEIKQSSSSAKKSSRATQALIECITKGVGFHHSGLSHIERKIVERGYRTGVISLLTATSTLAAGVNLPSKRVIFRGVRIGRSFLSCVDYKQMSGRAGRAGQKGAFGESFILMNELSFGELQETGDEAETASELITADMQPLMSSFFTNPNGLTRLILEILAILFDFGFGTSEPRERSLPRKSSGRVSILDLLTESTLMSHQRKLYGDLEDDQKGGSSALEAALSFLLEKEMVVVSKAKADPIQIGDYVLDYYCTSLGRAVASSGLTPSTGYELYRELERHIKRAFLDDFTYMCYLVAPFPPSESTGRANTAGSSLQAFFRLDWKLLYEVIKEMPVFERHSLVKLGFDLEQISWASQLGEDSLPPKLRETEFLRRHQRLFASQILRTVLTGTSPEFIFSKFKSVSSRDLQQLFTSALSICISCISFCHHMNWSSMQVIFQSLLRSLRAISLSEEYSGIFQKDQSLEKSIKKLMSGLRGISPLCAWELKETLSVKTVNQFLLVPRAILKQSIGCRVYSGVSESLRLVSNFVDNLFKDLGSSKKRIPIYNRQRLSENLKRRLAQNKFQTQGPESQSFFSDIELGNLAELEDCVLQLIGENYTQTGLEDVLSSKENFSVATQDNFNGLDLEGDGQFLDLLRSSQYDVDWEERLLFWSTPLRNSQD
ncbi:DEAD/DEAH box helicase family protein [Cryptosporidium felis]|nr:DEAD/DEAH box helicase family protein [Cryptosporidium felis]